MSNLCTVCKNPGVRKVIDGYLDESMTGAGISRALAELGLNVSADVVNRHRVHWEPALARKPNTSKRDFAILVRDKAIEQFEEGELNLADKDQVSGINAGLKAQQVIDKRESVKVQQNFWVQLFTSQQADLPLLNDGNVIDGEYEEVSDGE